MLTTINYPDSCLRFILVEGDSIDNTPQLLADFAANDERVTVVTHNTGREKFPQDTSPARLAHLAEVFNAGLDAVDTDWSDYVVFMPSDIVFDTRVISKLLARNVDYIAPFYWINEGKIRFYDLWGFSQGGIGFPPWGKQYYLDKYGDELQEMDTVGGLVMLNAELIANGARYGQTNADHGLCRAAQQLGATIYADPTVHIYHR